MLSPSALVRGIVARALPSVNPDAPQVDVPQRFGRYGEIYTFPLIRKQHGLADEGSYFTTNANAQAGILSSPATGFVATTPCMIIFNSDVVTNPNYKRVYLDGIVLATTVVGSAASGLVNLQFALYVDSGNRYSSGTTNLTPNIISPNMDVSPQAKALVYFGALTATAASASVRAVSPFRVIRNAVSGTVLDVVGEVKQFMFGGVESVISGSMVAANANFIPVPLPPLILGPQQSALMYLWQNVGATNVAATYAPEISWWER